MRYRRMDAKGDMIFGHGGADYLRDTPECVSQAVLTRLRLFRGEWFLDQTAGTPYVPLVFGRHTDQAFDPAIRERVLETPGVKGISAYESRYDGETRRLLITMTVDTVYGPVFLQEVM